MTGTGLGTLLVIFALAIAVGAVVVTWRAASRKVTMTTGSIIAAIGLGFVLAAILLPAFVIKGPDIGIVSPRDGQKVPNGITTKGTSQNLGQKQLWIVVEPRVNSRFYPQTSPVILKSGRWESAKIFIGNKQDAGKRFDILAVLADPKAQAEFTAYMSEGQRTHSFPGLDQLPQGAAIADRVSVTRG